MHLSHNQKMDLRHLHHLLLLADELNFSRAAERAHLTQSAFSRSIQAAEGLAGVKFFDRTQRSVKPTAVGARIIERGRRILAEAKDLDREIRFLEQGIAGHLRIGAGATVGGSVLTAIAFPASVVGSPAAAAAAPSIVWYSDRQPPRTTTP